MTRRRRQIEGRPGTRWSIRIERTWDGDPVADDEAVGLSLELGEDDLRVEVDAPYHDDPPPTSEDLWNYEVVELMMLGSNQTYVEVELSPHGRSLWLFLKGPRKIVRRETPLDYRAVIQGARWQGHAQIPIERLPLETTRLNAYAIHGIGEARRYLAWKPPGGPAPDFHRLAAFGSFDDAKERR